MSPPRPELGQFPYPRRHDAITVVPTGLVDRVTVVRRWAPWFTLQNSADSHLTLRSVPLLWEAIGRHDGDPDEARPRFGVWHPPGMRSVLRRQIGDASLGERDDRWSALRDAVLSWDMDELTALQTVALLGQLTLQGRATALASRFGSASTSAVGVHLRYLAAFLRWQVNPTDSHSQATLAAIAAAAPEASTAVTAANVLAVHWLRFGGSIETAHRWLDVAATMVSRLAEEPPWLRLLVISRLTRAVALTHFRAGERAETIRAMGRALDTSADLLAIAGRAPNRWTRHVAVENRRVALVTFARAHLGHDPASVASELDELNALEPYHPDTQLTLGDVFRRVGQFDRALDHYDRAAASGGGWGAAAAYYAAICCRELADDAAAASRLDLLRSLDPNADL